VWVVPGATYIFMIGVVPIAVPSRTAWAPDGAEVTEKLVNTNFLVRVVITDPLSPARRVTLAA